MSPNGTTSRSTTAGKAEEVWMSPNGTTLRAVEVPPHRLADYRGIAPDAVLDQAVALAATLDGARVLHINATPHGGGVAELLASEIGLLRDLGIDAEWRVICPDEQFFGRLSVIAPGIDPLAAKNRTLRRDLVRQIVVGYGIDVTRPLVFQLSRFDPWKDPLGVVAAWRLAREQVLALQLALVGSMADDDPEGWAIYDQVREATAGERDCRLLTNLTGIGALEVNAFQRQADVVVQKSLREGFGLTVSEALWKQRPVIGGNAGGIPLQLGTEGGLLVETTEECAEAIVRVLRDSALAERLAQSGHEQVRREFLIPRLLRDDLALYARSLGRNAPVPSAAVA